MHAPPNRLSAERLWYLKIKSVILLEKHNEGRPLAGLQLVESEAATLAGRFPKKTPIARPFRPHRNWRTAVIMATSKSPVATISSPPAARVSETVFRILLTISFCHLLNDTVQSLIMAYYPVLKTSYHLNFAHVGLITLTNQVTGSLLQPIIGMYTDRRPRPFSLAMGMAVTTLGLLSWSLARNFYMLLFSAALVGVGSAIFHPESSRVARMASGGQHGRPSLSSRS